MHNLSFTHPPSHLHKVVPPILHMPIDSIFRPLICPNLPHRIHQNPKRPPNMPLLHKFTPSNNPNSINTSHNPTSNINLTSLIHQLIDFPCHLIHLPCPGSVMTRQDIKDIKREFRPRNGIKEITS